MPSLPPSLNFIFIICEIRYDKLDRSVVNFEFGYLNIVSVCSWSFPRKSCCFRYTHDTSCPPRFFFPNELYDRCPPPLSFYRLVNTSEVRGRHSLIQPSFCQHWVFTLQYPTIFQTIFLFVPIYQQPFVAFLGSRYPFLGSTSTQPWLLWPFKKLLIPPVITCAGIDVFFLYCINESGKSGPRLSSQYHNLDGFPQTFVC
jgi:hypothetical protein